MILQIVILKHKRLFANSNRLMKHVCNASHTEREYKHRLLVNVTNVGIKNRNDKPKFGRKKLRIRRVIMNLYVIKSSYLIKSHIAT